MIAEADGTNYTVYNSSLEALEVKESALLVDETSLGCSWVAVPYGNGYALMNLGAEKYADIDAEGHISLSDSPKTLDIEFHDGMPTINGHALMMVINDKVTEVVNLPLLKPDSIIRLQLTFLYFSLFFNYLAD